MLLQEGIVGGFFFLAGGSITLITFSVIVYLLLLQLLEKSISNKWTKRLLLPLIALFLGSTLTFLALWLLFGSFAYS